MSEILSKEQIDQLLSGSGFTDAGKKTAPVAQPDEPLRKVADLFCRQLSAVLTTALNRSVPVGLVSCGKGGAEAVKTAFGENALCCTIPVTGAFAGSFWFLIGKKTAAAAGDHMMMQEPKGIFGAEHLDAITELVNQVFSSFATAYTAEYKTQLQIGASRAAEFSVASPPCQLDGCTIITGSTSIEGNGDAPCALLMTDELGSRLASGGNPAPAGSAAGTAKAGAVPGFIETHESKDAPARAMPVAKGPRAGKENVDMLLDIDLDVSIELGNSTLSIKRILELAPGSVIELDRMAGEPVDLMVNGKVVAKGEVVVIDESFGIRILSLVSPEERIKSLR